MAELNILGPWVGPGEERTAKRLVAGLPASWHILAGRKLPGSGREDVDFIVIGERKIFVIEEKFWGPSVITGDQYWTVKGQERKTPVDAATGKAKRVAGFLNSRLAVYKAHVTGQAVLGAVILSYPDVNLVNGFGADPSEEILTLDSACEELIAADAAAVHNLAPARSAVIALLTNEPSRDNTIKWIGDYRVTKVRPQIGKASCFLAEHPITHDHAELRCYPRYEWGEDDASAFVEREVAALQKLADLHRTFRFSAPFDFDKRAWFVVPVIRPKGITNLRDLVTARAGEEPPSAVDVAPIMADAFRALATVHDEGVVHRILSPERVWIDRRGAVLFSDFFLAKLEGEQTIVLFAEEDSTSVASRAPECAASVQFATTASDVYALAACMVGWWMRTPDTNIDAMLAWLSGQGRAGDLLSACLAANPEVRPTPEYVSSEFKDMARKKPAVVQVVEFEPGALIFGRYSVQRSIGEGGSATAWLAFDTNLNINVVLKQYHDVRAYSLAASEFASAHQANHPNCARLWDKQDYGQAGFVVQDYVPGTSLAERVAFHPASFGAAEVRRVAFSLLETLGYLHARNFVHGDVTPSNVIVDDAWNPKLIDFGLAVSIGDAATGMTRATAAPEILNGQPCSPLSDLYSMCCSLLRLTLHRDPYAESITSRVERVPVELSPEELATLDPELIAVLQALFEGIASDVEDRPSTALALEERIRTAAPRPIETPTAAEQTCGELARITNPTVESIRKLYRGSRAGNAGNRGLDDEFALATYVPTKLDTTLAPRIREGLLRVVLLTGNPGDGKTSFLVKVFDDLRQHGGVVEHRDEAGWRVTLDGKSFAAVYDASESHGDLSSDDLIRQAFASDKETHTALIAINDGRLLQFFTDYAHEFPEIEKALRRRRSGVANDLESVAVVDLKTRSLANHSGLGLGIAIADTFTADHWWTACGTCQSKAVCPILDNARQLQGSARESVGELLLTSHLRGRRRATFRDVRSALAWLITADLSCEDVHASRESGKDLRRGSRHQIHDLAFDAESSDYLVQEWAELDPANACAPSAERDLRELMLSDTAWSGLALHEVQRRAFFAGAHPLWRRQLRSYRHFDEFLDMLHAPDTALQRVLLGMSRICGAAKFDERGLAIGEQHPGADWAVLKVIPEDQFELSAAVVPEEYVEAASDHLRLAHRGGARIGLPLDTVEVVLRAADGELFGDAASEPIRQEILSFAARLRRQISSDVLIVDPTGSPSRATLVAGKIEWVNA